MATVTRKYIALESGQYKVRESQTDEVIFTAVRIGGSGGKDITLPGGNFDFAAAKLVNIADPTSAQDAATKAYTDTQVALVSAGFDPKASVDYATVAALPALTYANGTAGVGATLTATANGALSVDGVAVAVGNRILVKNQVAGLQNGIYDVTAAGSGAAAFVLTRSSDFDNSPANEVTKGAWTLVTTGNTLTGYAYFLATAGTITIGTTALSFSVTAGAVGTATAASGGGSLGVVTADSDLGLSITAGVLAAKLGTGLAFSGGNIAANYAVAKINDNAGTISVRQLVYIKANGNVDLATAVVATNLFAVGIVQDPTIATTATGLIVLRRGAIVSGYTGLTPGAHVYLHNATAGSYTQDPSTISVGNNLYSVGRAVSATEISFDPRHIAEM